MSPGYETGGRHKSQIGEGFGLDGSGMKPGMKPVRNRYGTARGFSGQELGKYLSWRLGSPWASTPLLRERYETRYETGYETRLPRQGMKPGMKPLCF